MAAIEQYLPYIIIVVILMVILILTLLIRRRRRVKLPKNLNEYLAEETERKEMEIIEQELGFKPKRFLLKSPQDKLRDIQKKTSQTLHKTIYLNSKIEREFKGYPAQNKQINFQKQLKAIEKKSEKLHERL